MSTGRPGKWGDTALHLAARSGSVAEVQKIIAECDPQLVGEFVARQNQDGETALYVSAERGRVEVLREILKACDVQSAGIKANNSFDAFHIATKHGHIDVLKELLQAFPALAMTTNAVNATALDTAAMQGYVDIVNLLLETDPGFTRIARNNGKTALHSAVRMGHVDVVVSLLSKDPQLCFGIDKKGQTALHMASKGQNAATVLEILKHNVSDINERDYKGNTPLHIAIRKGNNIVAQTLLSNDLINTSLVNRDGETAFDVAKKYGNEELANILRTAGKIKTPNSVEQRKLLSSHNKTPRMDGESSIHDSLNTILQDQNAEPCDLRLQYLIDITDNFSGKRELGRGGFGVVYKGTLPNGAMIAVKNLVSTTEIQDTQFKNEVDNLMRVRHQNIVRFLGYCYETWMKYIEYNGKHIFAESTPQRLLCFEYMPNGSLDRYISGEFDGLDWDKRYEIIRGICCGLNYLHEECQINGSIIHLDLKPANILLNDNMVPKIADFGLSRLFNDQKTRTCATLPLGPLGYMAPEYLFQGTITTKADIYSLGVIIIEIVAGRKISPYDTGKSCDAFVELVSRNWRNRLEASPSCTSLEIYCQQIRTCLEIGLSCVKVDPGERPSIREVIERLDK